MRAAICLLLLAACEQEAQKPMVVDARPFVPFDGGRCVTDGRGACNPVRQTGCDEPRCALLHLYEAGSFGPSGCLPQGTVAIGGDCTWRALPQASPNCATTFGDDCEGSGFCADGICRALCLDHSDCATGNCVQPGPLVGGDFTFGLCALE